MKSSKDGINPAAKPSGPGCAECAASGGWWLHLRRCAECGHIGCCDSSPSQHAGRCRRVEAAGVSYIGAQWLSSNRRHDPSWIMIFFEKDHSDNADQAIANIDN
jgi:hypothetical protein